MQPALTIRTRALGGLSCFYPTRPLITAASFRAWMNLDEALGPRSFIYVLLLLFWDEKAALYLYFYSQDVRHSSYS